MDRTGEVIDRTPDTYGSKKRVARECVECGENFLIATSIAHRYCTCSKVCSRLHHSKIQMGRKNSNWKGDDAVSLKPRLTNGKLRTRDLIDAPNRVRTGYGTWGWPSG